MPFNKAKHIKYWRMCSNVLPVPYTSTDSSRMTLGFFTVAALDLLGVLHENEDDNDSTTQTIPSDTRRGWINWIYGCQLDTGGFRGTAGMDLGERRNDQNKMWDPASVPATFFALAALLVLGDDLSRVRRDETVEWLPKLQRKDGSFGEILIGSGDRDEAEDEESWIGGGRDLRYCCCAAGIAYMLQDETGEGSITRSEVIHLEAMVRYIGSCQNYSGGFGESPYQEAHSGLTYCAVAALGFVQLLSAGKVTAVDDLISDRDGLVKWMIDRQTNVLEELGDESDDEQDEEPAAQNSTQTSPGLALACLNGDASQIVAGFNGREGKIADTCYCWWNTGALSILQAEHLVDADAMNKFLCDKVQHMIGGFGKGIDAPPDVLHSYLGLAALAAFGQEGLKPIDPTMCISKEAVGRLQKAKWKTKS